MHVAAGILVVCLVVGIDVVIFVVVMYALSRRWNRFALNFPACLPRPNAVQRRFQSFRMGLFNLGWSVHVAVDADMLHLTPVAMLRIGGAKSASIPWSEVCRVGPKTIGRTTTVVIRGVELTGPAWALSFVD